MHQGKVQASSAVAEKAHQAESLPQSRIQVPHARVQVQNWIHAPEQLGQAQERPPPRGGAGPATDMNTVLPFNQNV